MFTKLFLFKKHYLLIIIAIHILITYLIGTFGSNRIIIDAPSYYLYLPATFIYDDLSLRFIDNNPAFFEPLTFYNITPEGNRVIKHTMGVCLFLMPFFFIAHFIALAIEIPSTGYGLLYQNVMSIGVLSYLLAGLYCLRNFLLNFFKESSIAFTLIIIIFGTNLLWYTSYETFMSHSLAFALISACTFLFYNWLKNKNEKYLMFFITLFLLAILVRPLLILLGIYYLFLGINYYKNDRSILPVIPYKNPFFYFKIVIIAVIILFPQLLYYKIYSGHWFYNGYINEPFLWTRPEILEFMLGFRKGWLIYTPIMVLAFAGLYFIYRHYRVFFLPTVILLISHIYILSAWWAWNYQASFGMRSMIDYYPLLSIPIAATIQHCFKKGKLTKVFIGFIAVLFICLNLFQTWQFKNKLIHNEYMTKEAYFKGFFQTKTSNEWYDLLKFYDYDRRKKGLPQIEFDYEYFLNLKNGELIYLRSSENLNYLTLNTRYNYIEANFPYMSNSGLFQLFKLEGDTVVAFRAVNGYYLNAQNDFIQATSKNITSDEKFIISFINEKDNKIKLINLDNTNCGIYAISNRYFLSVSKAENKPAQHFRIYHFRQDK